MKLYSVVLFLRFSIFSWLQAQVVEASFCSGGPHSINLSPGGKQQFSCSGTCYACLVHFEVTQSTTPYDYYFINILSNGNYVFEASAAEEGPLTQGPALFGDATGSATLQFEFECDAANPSGTNCNDMQLSWGFVNCGCPDGQYISRGCSGTNDATCSTEPPEPGDGWTCFSGETTVHVANVLAPVPLKTLKVGTLVLTNSPKDPYQPVYMFAHIDAKANTNYLQIFTADPSINGVNHDFNASRFGTPLEITDDHLVYVEGKKHPVPAGTVQVGDHLLRRPLEEEGDYETATALVTEIRRVVRRGLYAPLTAHGTIVLTEHQVVASTYVSIQPQPEDLSQSSLATHPWLLHQADLAHIWLSPVRFLCDTNGESLVFCNSRNEEGMQHLVAFGLSFADWLHQQHYAVQVVLVLLSLVVTGPFRLMEMALGPFHKMKVTTQLLLLIGTAVYMLHRATTLDSKGGFKGKQPKQKAF
jgi:Hint module